MADQVDHAADAAAAGRAARLEIGLAPNYGPAGYDPKEVSVWRDSPAGQAYTKGNPNSMFFNRLD